MHKIILLLLSCGTGLQLHGGVFLGVQNKPLLPTADTRESQKLAEKDTQRNRQQVRKEPSNGGVEKLRSDDGHAASSNLVGFVKAVGKIGLHGFVIPFGAAAVAEKILEVVAVGNDSVPSIVFGTCVFFAAGISPALQKRFPSLNLSVTSQIASALITAAGVWKTSRN